ncbi:RNA polymerase, sigma-24 subunit, ECF subfamily [Desulfofarcimen acetoxidans DSM 771]|uniref:RNA polymerase, sigma-24 subunit, ECF subfamily n=1 Tax=Desulfofarcimen acetoxidans (strain ATCC 49208 / DSM 771 / KCTC 5769 / VKM B-1644 / 5575) TaxID=485916 RepID=C8VXR1_DESAS|nr:sigma-70 family RNA polymerase sigma factor [Desulfofarcimen acetoxidans]ACV62717.1 RNA polymerase, sigma-24 subunit, ECF subfamily [Desulfofarcimen acetoxidans DSM 771]
MDNWIDKQALKYAQTKEPAIFEDIFRRLKPKLDRLADRNSNKYASLRIPAEDYKSYYYEALWRAAENFNGRTPFIRRVNLMLYESEVRLYRYYASKKRAVFLKEIIDDRHMLIVEFDTAVENEMLEGFLQNTSERNSKIIKLLQIGCTKQEIADVLGCSWYNKKARKTVQRAKDQLRRFIAVNQAS